MAFQLESHVCMFGKVTQIDGKLHNAYFSLAFYGLKFDGEMLALKSDAILVKPM